MPPFHRVTDLEQLLRGCYSEFGLWRHPDPGPDPQNLLAPILTRLHHVQDQLDRMEQFNMTTAAEFKAQQDATAAEITKESGIITSIVTAMNAQATLISSLNDQIAALQAAGAGAITQQQLDDLAAEGSATLTAAQSNTATLSGLVPQSTSAAGAAAAEPQPAAGPAIVDGAAPTT